jgi:putative ABC transport system permease protein
MITAFAGLLCGLAPALSTSRANLNFALKEKSAAATRRRFSLRSFLVVTEVALALVLLTGSALMVQSMVRLLKVDTGLRIDHVHSAVLNLPKGRYGSEDAYRLFAQRLLDTLRVQPQFSEVSLSSTTVMQSGLSMMALDRSSLAALGMKEETLNLETRSVSPGFFETFEIPLVRGRFFNDHDVKGAPAVIVISNSAARRFFPGQDAIGKTLKLGTEASSQYQIAGLVPDTLDVNLHGRPQLQVYFPLQQSSNGMNFLNILVRTSAEPSAAIASLRSAVGSVDKDQPLSKIQSMTEVISESVAQPRFRAWMLSAFALAGLTLTMIGIYGVISYSAGQRTQEMGIRMALGAPRSSVLRMVLREGVVLALAGAVCGVVGSFLLMRLLASQLYGIKPGDPPTLVGAALLMVLVALAGSYFPARKATKVDPMIALRYE